MSGQSPGTFIITMDFTTFKAEVQALVPVKFEDTLIYLEDNTAVDSILNQAIKVACSGFEKIKNVYYVGTTTISDAISVVKCVPSDENDSERGAMSVWDLLPEGKQEKVKHYFTPSDKILRVEPAGTSVYVEYVVDPNTLDVEDLDIHYTNWAVEYAVALLKIKEGYKGSQAVVKDSPFEFNYADMRTEGITDKDTSISKLEEMSMGTLAIRVS